MPGSTPTLSRTRHKSPESPVHQKVPAGFGGRLRGKGPPHPAGPRRAAHPVALVVIMHRDLITSSLPELQVSEDSDRQRFEREHQPQHHRPPSDGTRLRSHVTRLCVIPPRGHRLGRHRQCLRLRGPVEMERATDAACSCWPASAIASATTASACTCRYRSMMEPARASVLLDHAVWISATAIGIGSQIRKFPHPSPHHRGDDAPLAPYRG